MTSREPFRGRRRDRDPGLRREPSRAPWLLLLGALAASPVPVAAGVAAAAGAPEAKAVAEPEVADVDLPGEPGGVRAGGTGTTLWLEEPRDVPPLPSATASMDFPEWLGEVTGLWKPRPAAEEDQAQALHLILAPFVTSSPLIGAGFGVAAAGTLQLGERETTRLSKFATNLLVTTESQLSIPIRASIYLPGGNWKLQALWRWSKFPSPTWGIGGDTPDSAESTTDYDLVRLQQTLSRRVTGDLYVGAGYLFDCFYGIENAAPYFQGYPYGTGPSSLNSGLALNVLYDDRDSPVYPSSGTYAMLNLSISPRWLGSDTEWYSVYLDGRTYLPLGNRAVLALWGYAWLALGQVPYLELAAIGGDFDARSGRGYTEGRHIGKALLYAEAEVRFTVWQWLGGVVGVNVHSVAQPDARGILVDEPRFQYWWPAFVVGARILAVRETRSNLTVDFAMGLDGQSGVYVNFSEAF